MSGQALHDQAFLARAIAQGRGSARADLVLKGGRIYDLVTGALTPSDVAICGDRIVGTHGDYSGAVEIDVRGKVIVLVAADNLIRGASGVAVQNFNLMFGYPETTGLW